jgi:hypothetical protein
MSSRSRARRSRWGCVVSRADFALARAASSSSRRRRRSGSSRGDVGGMKPRLNLFKSLSQGPVFFKSEPAAHGDGEGTSGHHNGQFWVVIHRLPTNAIAIDSPKPPANATPTATARSPIAVSTSATAQAVTAASTVHQA